MAAMRPCVVTLYLLAALATVAPRSADAARDRYQVNHTASHLTIHVGKAGAFSFIAGHTHEVTGPIANGSVDVDLDTPSRSVVRLVIMTSELKVSAAGEPEGDVPKVQEAMDGEKVLDVGRYPRITFESTAVTAGASRGATLDVIVNGQLTIRDVTHPISVPVHVDMAGDALTATGRFSIKQSAFRIKPISVGGVVAVKDTLEIDFSISASK
jgi:polyisoprenoid-binding protein YceI